MCTCLNITTSPLIILSLNTTTSCSDNDGGDDAMISRVQTAEWLTQQMTSNDEQWCLTFFWGGGKQHLLSDHILDTGTGTEMDAVQNCIILQVQHAFALWRNASFKLIDLALSLIALLALLIII